MITVYACDGRIVRPLPASEIGATLARAGAIVWVDIDTTAGRAEGEPLLRDVFGFHPLTIDDCYNTLIDPPKIDDYGGYLFVILHELRYDAERELLAASEIDLYLGSNFVVSVHPGSQNVIESVRRRIQNGAPDMERGAAFLAHALFDVAIDDYHPIVDALDDELESIERAVLEAPQRETPERIMRLKRNALRLKRSILPQRDVANRFSRGEHESLVPEPARMYFRDVYDHTVRVDEMIDAVRDRAESAMTTHLSAVNNRINEVMKALAIVAVIFLPLTLVPSVYGTNFDDTFPSYGWAPGFAVMLAGMGLLGAGLLAWFRWRRWF